MSLMTQNCDKRSPRHAGAKDLSHHDLGNCKRLHQHATGSSRFQTKRFCAAKGTSAMFAILFLVGLCSANPGQNNPYQTAGMTKGMNFGVNLCLIGFYLCIAAVICFAINDGSITCLDGEGIPLQISLDLQWKILLGVGLGTMVLGTSIGMYFANSSKHNFQWSAGAYGCLLLETVVVRSTAGLLHLGISVFVLPFLLCWWVRLCFTYKEASPLLVGLFMLFQGVYTVSSITFCRNANKLSHEPGRYKSHKVYFDVIKNRVLTPVAVDKAKNDYVCTEDRFQKKLKDFSMDKKYPVLKVLGIYLIMIAVNGLLTWVAIHDISLGRWPIISVVLGIILPPVLGGFVVPWLVKNTYTAPKNNGSTYANKESEEDEYLRMLTRESTNMGLNDVEKEILRQKSLVSVQDAITGRTDGTDRRFNKCLERLETMHRTMTMSAIPEVEESHTHTDGDQSISPVDKDMSQGGSSVSSWMETINRLEASMQMGDMQSAEAEIEMLREGPGSDQAMMKEAAEKGYGIEPSYSVPIQEDVVVAGQEEMKSESEPQKLKMENKYSATQYLEENSTSFPSFKSDAGYVGRLGWDLPDAEK